MTPLVSCLLCTRSRRHVLPIALAGYLSQSYENRELIVVDDGEDRIEDLLDGIPNVTYIWHPAKNLAEKRNVGIAAAKGEVICHVDDDDWSGASRIGRQLVDMESDALVAGFNRVHFFDWKTRQASRFTGGIWSATFAYWKSYALEHPWDESIDFAEDVKFLQPALDQNRIVSSDGADVFVAGMVAGNVKRFPIGAPEFKELWPIVPVTDLPEGFRKLIH